MYRNGENMHVILLFIVVAFSFFVLRNYYKSTDMIQNDIILRKTF